MWTLLVFNATLAIGALGAGPCDALTAAATAAENVAAAEKAAQRPTTLRPAEDSTKAVAAVAHAETAAKTEDLATIAAGSLLRARQLQFEALRTASGRAVGASGAVVASELSTAKAALTAAKAAAASITPALQTAFDSADATVRRLEAAVIAAVPGVAVAGLGPGVVDGTAADRFRDPGLDALRAAQAKIRTAAAGEDDAIADPTKTKAEKAAAANRAQRHRVDANAMQPQIDAAVAAVRATARKAATDLVAARVARQTALTALGNTNQQSAAKTQSEAEANVRAVEAEQRAASAVELARAALVAATGRAAAARAVVTARKRVLAEARVWEAYDQSAEALVTARAALGLRKAEVGKAQAAADGLEVTAGAEVGAAELDFRVAVARARVARDQGLETRLKAEADRHKAAVEQMKADGQWFGGNVASVLAATRAKLGEIRQFAEGDFRMHKEQARAAALARFDKALGTLSPYSCLDSIKAFVSNVQSRRMTVEQASAALVVDADRSAVSDPDLYNPPSEDPRPKKFTVSAAFAETIVNGEAAKVMHAKLVLTFDFATGAVSGTFQGQGQGDIDAACDTRLHYTYSHSLAVSGAFDVASGKFVLPISPAGSSQARFTQKGTCQFKPGGTGPWAGKGTITGAISAAGQVTLATAWRVQKIGLSGRWSGAGGVVK